MSTARRRPSACCIPAQHVSLAPATVDEYEYQSARFWYGILRVAQKPVHAATFAQYPVTTLVLWPGVSANAQVTGERRTSRGTARRARSTGRRTRP
jgi:hypothetical protein